MSKVAIGVALLLSGIAAYFSVLGMTAIFPASYWEVLLMTSSLEAAKVVTIVWIHQHWNKISGWIKTYLCIASITLMCITSMGVFGFLSKAHIQHQIKIDSGVKQDIKLVEEQIKLKNTEIASIENKTTKGVTDKALSKMVEVSKDTKALNKVLNAAKSNDDNPILLKKQEELSELNSKKIKLEGELSIQEADVGPIKYLANLYFDNASSEQLEKAVRIAIVILVLNFDPLAILLLLGVSSVMKDSEEKETEPKRKVRIKKGVVVIPDKNLMKM